MAAVEAEAGEEEAGEAVVVVEAESQTGEARMTWTLNLVGIARCRDHNKILIQSCPPAEAFMKAPSSSELAESIHAPQKDAAGDVQME